ncbi:MAG: acetyl xylan esterase, partial [Lachnospiraceae bacterium]|nr:acetyl xylan esterase [Lachnospiraceae bacterium]
CALQEYYVMAAVTKQNGKFSLVMSGVEDMDGRKGKETIYERIALDSAVVQIRLKVDFMDGKDEAVFFYLSDTKESDRTWKQIGIQKKLRFTLGHFAGCRFGLFSYATKQTGGKAVFRDFIRYDFL